MMNMRIREATVEDADALAALCGQLGYPVDAPAVEGRLHGIAAHDAGVVLVAGDGNGAVCGFAHALPQRFLSDEPFVELAALVVADVARGSGVGSALLAVAEGWAQQYGLHGVRVRSNVVRERAHRFYLRKGYVERKRQAVFAKQL